eukprot:1158387-Pelagomonas_calceolata.AAC.9
MQRGAERCREVQNGRTDAVRSCSEIVQRGAKRCGEGAPMLEVQKGVVRVHQCCKIMQRRAERCRVGADAARSCSEIIQRGAKRCSEGAPML